jgi:hypothetical protein
LLEGGVLHCDLIKTDLRFINHTKETKLYQHCLNFSKNDSFILEIKHFLDCFQNRKQTQIPLMEGKGALAMSLAIHQSLKTHSPEIIHV